MKFQLPLILYRESQGSIAYTGPSLTGFPPVVPSSFVGARNGTSQDAAGFVVLGNDVGAAQATLLSNREIPMGGFSITFSGMGAGNNSGNIIFKESATKTTNAEAWFDFQNSAGVVINSFRWHSNTSYYIGFNSGSLATGSSNIGIGQMVFNVATTANGNQAYGTQALRRILDGVHNVAIGSFAGENIVSGNDNIMIGFQAMDVSTNALNNISVGTNTLLRNITGSDNVVMGFGAAGETLAVGTTNPTQSVIIGSNAGVQRNFGTGTIAIGFKSMFNVTPGTNCIFIGANSFLGGGTSTIGNSCILIGDAQTLTGGGTLANNVIWIGTSITNVTAGITNLTLIGSTMSSSISNVVGLGRADQNIILGVTAIAADNGNRLQVNGKLNTAGAAPLTLGAGAMDFGKIVAAASVLNAAKYWEVLVDGVLQKVCIN